MIQIKTEQRYELKYLVRHDEAAAIARDLTDYMLADQHGDSQGHYLVTSLYFDTVDHKAYWDKINGHKNRRKLRIRVYGDQPVTPDTPCYVEIKHRLDRALQKRRVSLPYANAVALDRLDDRYDTVPDADRRVLEEVKYLVESLQLQPTCVVSYLRQALQGAAYDPGLRVTFDSNLKYRSHDLSLLGNDPATGHYFLPPDWCIMEVKVNHRAPYWLTEVIGKHQCVVRRVSKYCAALEHSRVVLGHQHILS